MVYRAAVLGVLLYGAETWATKRVSTQKVEAFNNRCLRRIMNISRAVGLSSELVTSAVSR